jgi:hypothetical protein
MYLGFQNTMSALWHAPILRVTDSNSGPLTTVRLRSWEQIVSRKDTDGVAHDDCPVAFPGMKTLPFPKVRSAYYIFALSVSDFHQNWQTVLATTSHGVVRPINLTRLTGLMLFIRLVTPDYAN